MQDDMDYAADGDAELLLTEALEADLLTALAALGVDPAQVARSDLAALARAVADGAPEELDALRTHGAPADPVRFGAFIPTHLSHADRILEHYEGFTPIDPFGPRAGEP